MLTSTHKIAGSLTQSAMLHVGHSGRVDAGAVARALRLLRSTSPSSLLLASLDGARRQLALHGEQLLHETLEAIEVARAKLEDDPRHRARRLRARSAAWAWPATTRCGWCSTCAARAAPATRSPTSCAAPTTSTSSCRCRRPSCSSSASATPRPRCGAWRATSTRSSSACSEPGATAPIVPPAASLSNEVALSPREAFLGEAEQVAVDAAVGRISCESIASYPPGVPALLPGERISAETVAYLRELADSGARLHGASDPAFQTINVPAWRRSTVIDPQERWAAVRREARLQRACSRSPACPTPRIPRSSRASTSRSSARRWTTSSPTARARASRRARSAAASSPPGPHLEVKIDAFAELRVVDFGDAPVIPADPVTSHAAIEATVGQVLAAGVDAGRARRRPLDHRAVAARLRGRARPGRARPLRHPHRHRRGGLRRRVLARHVHPPPRRPGPPRRRAATPRSACAATGRARRSSPGRPSAGSRACSCTTSATSASARWSGARSRPSGRGRPT